MYNFNWISVSVLFNTVIENKVYDFPTSPRVSMVQTLDSILVLTLRNIDKQLREGLKKWNFPIGGGGGPKIKKRFPTFPKTVPF